MELLLPNLGVIVWSIIAFVVVLIILRKAAWKPILKSLSDREQGITDALAAAENAKAELANLKSENENLLQQARVERSNMLKEAKETSDKIVAEAQAKAQAQTHQMIEDAKAVIDHQKNQALAEVKTKVGNIAVEIAEKVLRRELAQKSQQEAYINELTNDIKLN